MGLVLLADAIARVRNAGERRRRVVFVRSSKFVFRVLACLRDAGYIGSVGFVRGYPYVLRVGLLYGLGGVSVLGRFELVSRPGRVVYKTARELVGSREGRFLVSTSAGLVFSDMQLYRGGLVLLKLIG